jgi:hypothetical protein
VQDFLTCASTIYATASPRFLLRRVVDYLLLTHLWTIIKAKWKDFEPIFPQGQAFVESLIQNDVNVSRAVFAHMNPLEENDIKNLEASFRKWLKNLQAVKERLAGA